MGTTSDTTTEMPAPPIRTWEDLKAKKKPNTQKVRIALDPEIAEEFSEAVSRLEIAKIRHNARPNDEGATQQLLEAQEEVDRLKPLYLENSTEFVFKAIGRKKYEELVLAHPPTDAQRKQVADMGEDPKQLGWNSDTFPPLIVADSVRSPKMTRTDVKEMWDSDEWNAAELRDLLQAAVMANSDRKNVDLGNA